MGGDDVGNMRQSVRGTERGSADMRVDSKVDQLLAIGVFWYVLIYDSVLSVWRTYFRRKVRMQKKRRKEVAQGDKHGTMKELKNSKEKTKLSAAAEKEEIASDSIPPQRM